MKCTQNTNDDEKDRGVNKKCTQQKDDKLAYLLVPSTPGYRARQWENRPAE